MTSIHNNTKIHRKCTTIFLANKISWLPPWRKKNDSSSKASAVRLLHFSHDKMPSIIGLFIIFFYHTHVIIWDRIGMVSWKVRTWKMLILFICQKKIRFTHFFISRFWTAVSNRQTNRSFRSFQSSFDVNL